MDRITQVRRDINTEKHWAGLALRDARNLSREADHQRQSGNLFLADFLQNEAEVSERWGNWRKDYVRRLEGKMP